MQQVSWNVNEYHTCRLKAAGKNKPVADSNREIEYIHQMARPCSRSRHRCQVDYSAVQMQWPIGNEIMAKIIINDTKTICFKTAISILLISNDNSFRVLFDKIASVYFIWKIYLYFSIGNGQPREPALCQLYRHTFVPYTRLHDYYSTPDRQTEYHNDRVCLSVCVLVLPRAYRWNYKFDVHQFIRPMHAAYVRSSW